MTELFINVDSILPYWRWNALAGIRGTVKLCDEKLCRWSYGAYLVK